jgi:hypothetical protein
MKKVLYAISFILVFYLLFFRINFLFLSFFISDSFRSRGDPDGSSLKKGSAESDSDEVCIYDAFV